MVCTRRVIIDYIGILGYTFFVVLSKLFSVVSKLISSVSVIPPKQLSYMYMHAEHIIQYFFKSQKYSVA